MDCPVNPLDQVRGGSWTLAASRKKTLPGGSHDGFCAAPVSRLFHVFCSACETTVRNVAASVPLHRVPNDFFQPDAHGVPSLQKARGLGSVVHASDKKPAGLPDRSAKLLEFGHHRGARGAERPRPQRFGTLDARARRPTSSCCAPTVSTFMPFN